MSAPLHLVNVTLCIGAEALVNGQSLTVPPGEIVTIMGPSGSGKSTILAAIAGTLPVSARMTGEVYLGKRRLDTLPPEARRVGILFQDDLLFPHLSVGDNLAFALPAEVPRRERRARVEAALDEAGLPDMAMRDPATLSGGQRARAAVMRTLLAQPQALLLDEAFSALDVALRENFRRFVFDHAREANLPALLVTHDPADAAAAGGLVVTLQQGRFVATPHALRA